VVRAKVLLHVGKLCPLVDQPKDPPKIHSLLLDVYLDVPDTARVIAGDSNLA